MTGYPLRDADIRRLLHDRLEALHAADPCARIIHELSIPRPAARADLVALNGSICGFEIKSDVDSLSRLPKQIKSFSAVFDRVDVVSTDKHSKIIVEMLPDWWGIQIVHQNANRLAISPLRIGDVNPDPNNEALLHVLHVREIMAVCDLCNIKDPPKRMRKDERISAVLSSADAQSIRNAVREVLKVRA